MRVGHLEVVDEHLITDAEGEVQRLRDQMLHRRLIEARRAAGNHCECSQRSGERIRLNIGSFQTLYLCRHRFQRAGSQRFHTRLRDVRVGDCGLRNMRLFNGGVLDVGVSNGGVLYLQTADGAVLQLSDAYGIDGDLAAGNTARWNLTGRNGVCFQSVRNRAQRHLRVLARQAVEAVLRHAECDRDAQALCDDAHTVT